MIDEYPGFSAFTRQAADAVSRRASLVTLGGAALAAAVATPDVSEAKKKSGDKYKKKEKKRCNNDAAACKTTVTAQCEGDPDCLTFLPCCDECSANGFMTCLIALSPS